MTANKALVQSRISHALQQKGMTRITAIRRITETAMTEVTAVHRYTIDTAKRTLSEAERIQRSAGRNLEEPAFQQLTEDYLNELTRITEEAGIDILNTIDRALR
jgi:hypothetical protein